MTTLDIGRPPLATSRPSLAAVWSRAAAAEPLYAGAAIVLAVMMLPTLMAMAIDTRTLDGVNVWMKPFKFELALVVYLMTLAWFASFLPAGLLRSRRHRIFTVVVTLCVAAEMIWLVGAAAAGVASHFNESSTLMQTTYSLMGISAVVITSASLMQGIAFARLPSPVLAEPVRLAMAIGLILTFVLTLITAGYMSSSGGHGVGADAARDGGTVFFGWLRNGGDLRVAHFFATHALHAVPIAGLAALAMPQRLRRPAVIVVAALYAAFVLLVLVQAIAGRPFLPMDG